MKRAPPNKMCCIAYPNHSSQNSGNMFTQSLLFKQNYTFKLLLLLFFISMFYFSFYFLSTRKLIYLFKLQLPSNNNIHSHLLSTIPILSTEKFMTMIWVFQQKSIKLKNKLKFIYEQTNSGIKCKYYRIPIPLSRMSDQQTKHNLKGWTTFLFKNSSS